MTTVLDVIAKAMGDQWYGEDACHCSQCAAEHQQELDKAQDAISDLVAAPEPVRLELAAMLNPWRPIETAPKDGTRILVAFQNHEKQTRLTCVRWDEKYQWLVGVDHESGMRFCLNRRQPTYWLLLPAPPLEDKT